ncbi:uncharacterized protein LOC117606171 isoform X1 [Osmia lignaria lignaria]|uniref:uncharacterized protein LOC117606171 isoform X1 n=1 Tax=Osmia lignaria lignaria TaxID=1437193 RepID=UPI0014787FD2|nr:uncharacterized protein LOC117606171 isoform X2 [Osmia lignaria]
MCSPWSPYEYQNTSTTTTTTTMGYWLRFQSLVRLEWDEFTTGISVPVSMNKRGSVVFSAAFQFNYKLPSNLSELEPTIMPARQTRDLSLQDTYESIENLFERYGWQDGRRCLLRTICELAETPFGRTRRDVLEEVIHLILTPTEDLPRTANSTHQSVDQLYQEAERLGRSGGDCILAYPDCIESPLETFTEIAFP